MTDLPPLTPALQEARDACRAMAWSALPRDDAAEDANRDYVDRCRKADAVIYYALGRPVSCHEVGMLDEHDTALVTRRFGELASGDLELVPLRNGRYEARRRGRGAA